MCLTLTGRISAIDGATAVVEIDGRDREVSLAVLVLEDRPVSVGDWVLIHTGFAVEVLDPGEGADLARLRAELVRPAPEPGP